MSSSLLPNSPPALLIMAGGGLLLLLSAFPLLRRLSQRQGVSLPPPEKQSSGPPSTPWVATPIAEAPPDARAYVVALTTALPNEASDFVLTCLLDGICIHDAVLRAYEYRCPEVTDG